MIELPMFPGLTIGIMKNTLKLKCLYEMRYTHPKEHEEINIALIDFYCDLEIVEKPPALMREQLDNFMYFIREMLAKPDAKKKKALIEEYRAKRKMNKVFEDRWIGEKLEEL